MLRASDAMLLSVQGSRTKAQSHIFAKRSATDGVRSKGHVGRLYRRNKLLPRPSLQTRTSSSFSIFAVSSSMLMPGAFGICSRPFTGFSGFFRKC